MKPVLRLLPLLALAAPTLAQTIDVDAEAPISKMLFALPEEVREYHDHISFLAHPFLEGRLPGTRGMEIAKDYCEQYLSDMGLLPVFENGTSYRQPFSLGSRNRVSAAHLSVGDQSFVAGSEFSVTGMGAGGASSGPVVFCGYGIDRGSQGYRGFPEGTDLTGKVAVIFRFEPMDEEGVSLWASRPPWSTKAGFSRKLRDLEKLGAAAVVIVNPPGAKDERINSLMEGGGSGSGYVEIPVLMMVPEAGQRMLTLAGVESSLMELRREADAAGLVRDLGFELRLEARIEVEELLAENVIGMLPGKGVLKDEIVVLGAHLDHLGQGNFGSREGAGKLHPGADDNASGSAAVIMIAEDLVADYAALPEGSDARTILFMLFSAEESGLIGSQYYANNPAFPIEQHKLMVNFDMIGRISNKRLSLSGAQTGEGLAEFLEPLIDATPLEIVQPENMSGASDHTPFYRAKMPVLFSIIADFHDDYHTSRDTAD
ncbi:MAG: M28 family peptidase, partial [Planctomycetota bacterium]|nr:M28 family peptidase [Planctomycetota bacterium]